MQSSTANDPGIPFSTVLVKAITLLLGMDKPRMIMGAAYEPLAQSIFHCLRKLGPLKHHNPQAKAPLSRKTNHRSDRYHSVNQDSGSEAPSFMHGFQQLQKVVILYKISYPAYIRKQSYNGCLAVENEGICINSLEIKGVEWNGSYR